MGPDDGRPEVHVLHVDDDRGVAELAADYLSRMDDGIDVTTATSASEALQRLATGRFDCVVSDYDMPGRDGIELLEAVRSAYGDIPFILYTGKGSEEVASDAIAAGVTDYLRKKPGSGQFLVLANRIRNAVELDRAETRAAQADRRSNVILDASPDAILVSLDGEYVYANPAAVSLLGTDSVHDILGRSVTAFAEPEDQAALEDVVASVRAGEQAPTRINRTIRSVDGKSIPVEVTTRRIDWEGRAGVLAIIRDRSEPEARLGGGSFPVPAVRTVLDAVEANIFVADADGRHVLANERAQVALGIDDAVAGVRAEEFLPADMAERFLAAHRRVIESGERVTVEETVPTEDGSRTYLIRLSPIRDGNGDVYACCGVATDITEQESREQTLARERSLLASLLDTTLEGILVVDENREYVRWNDQFVDLWGVPEDLLGEGSEHAALEWVRDELADPDAFLETVEYLYEHPDEEVLDQVELADGRMFDRYSAPLEGPDATYFGRVWFFRDVTDREAREDRLEQLHEATRDLMVAPTAVAVARIASETATTLLDLPMNGIHLHDPAEDALVPAAWSDALESVYGGSPPSIPAGEGLAWRAFEAGNAAIHSDVRERDAALNPGTPFRSEVYLPLGEYGVLLAASTEPNDFGAPAIAVARVLAANVEVALDRVEREQELHATNDRLEEFASILSHDLRNPLTVAQGNLELLGEDHDDPRIGTIRKSLDRMAELIDDVLTLARADERRLDPEPVELGAVARRCWDSSVDTRGATLEADTDVVLTADEGRLAQLLENLFRNAVEHGGDGVTVRVGDLDGRGFFVEDDGPGVADGDYERLFEQGFTTVDSGVGLGLSIVRENARAHGWTVRASAGTPGGFRVEVTGADRRQGPVEGPPPAAADP